MVRLGIGMVMMIMPVIMPMSMPVIMPVIMMMMVVMVAMAIHLFQATFTGTESGAEIAIFDIAARGGNACTFDMVMVAFLRQADFIFKAKHLSTIFTHRAVHVVTAGENFAHRSAKVAMT